MQAHLAARELACRRGGRLLFRGLDFALAPGDALHVAGANGVGKSSLLRILAGLLPAAEGTIEGAGEIALLDERPALDPDLPLRRSLAFWKRLDRAADDPLPRLGLGELCDVPLRYLSSGQAKRAALARLLGQQAPIWLLDEPLNALDREGSALLGTLIADHREAGGILVIASHQPIDLAGGRRIELGTGAG